MYRPLTRGTAGRRWRLKLEAWHWSVPTRSAMPVLSSMIPERLTRDDSTHIRGASSHASRWVRLLLKAAPLMLSLDALHMGAVMRHGTVECVSVWSAARERRVTLG
jgi:hypothetical protein